MLAGVAGGLGEYFDVDPLLVRLAWVVLCFATVGFAILAYTILAIIMPRDESRASRPPDVESGGVQGPAGEESPAIGAEQATASRERRRRGRIALILIVVGLAVLVINLNWLWTVVWPLLLIGLGIAILRGRSRRR